jgi:predicted nucleic acid-binding Zn ribbon protein
VPAYHYQCTHCQVTACRIGGVDDHLAICARCGHLMLRLDYDLFSPYFEASASTVTPLRPRTQGQSQKNT